MKPGKSATLSTRLARLEAARAAVRSAERKLEAAEKVARFAKGRFKAAKKAHKLARKVAKRAAKQARQLQERLQKCLAAVAGLRKPQPPSEKVATKHLRPPKSARAPLRKRVSSQPAVVSPLASVGSTATVTAAPGVSPSESAS
jgi:hypothetical protein